MLSNIVGIDEENDEKLQKAARNEKSPDKPKKSPAKSRAKRAATEIETAAKKEEVTKQAINEYV